MPCSGAAEKLAAKRDEWRALDEASCIPSQN